MNNFSLAIVGARKCEEDSKIIAENISYNLAKNKITIISGMALGIDSIAHQGALKARGKTIAVLGAGFNNIYPKENRSLFYKILDEGGLIISEYDLDVPPLRHNFLCRNRIVAALSDGLVLIEAKENSGSITTAKFALTLNRNLFVLPGAVSDLNYRGSNKLLRCGGKCILDYKDVLEEYENFSGKELIESYNDEIRTIIDDKIDIPEEYTEIFKCLSNKPKSINQISIELNIPISVLTSKITLMEMDGYMKQLPGKTFIRCD